MGAPLGENEQALMPEHWELFCVTPGFCFITVGKSDEVEDKSIDNFVWELELFVDQYTKE